MHDDTHWANYNRRQFARPVRTLCKSVLALAGPGNRRTAVDLGCGAGIETRALLEAGWRVHAVDGEPGTSERLLRTIGGVHERLTVDVRHFDELTDLPAADLVYAGYSLPFQDPEEFRRMWSVIWDALQPAGWFAGNLLGENDSWAGDVGMTFLSEGEARALFDAGPAIERTGDPFAEQPGVRGAEQTEVQSSPSANRPAAQPSGERGTGPTGDLAGETTGGRRSKGASRPVNQADLQIVSWLEEDADGEAFSGPKHWHIFDFIARRGPG